MRIASVREREPLESEQHLRVLYFIESNMERITTHISGISGSQISFFTAALIKVCCPNENAKEFLLINRQGIRNVNFLNYLNSELQIFGINGSISRESVEKIFGFKFVQVRVRGQKVSFIEQAAWGPEIIFFEKWLVRLYSESEY
jgi:hypothetical protein